MYSTFGCMLKVEPTEFADRVDAVSPHRPISLELPPRCQRSWRLPLPPALAVTMSSQHYTVHHIASSFAEFCPGHLYRIILLPSVF